MLAFLAVMAGILLALVVVVIYLNDRVNELERRTLPAEGTAPLNASVAAADSGWLGLGGKRLWDAMTGKPVQGVSAEVVEMLRPHYEPVLAKHIEGLFRDGQKDGAIGHSRSATAVRKVFSTRGPVESWMPLNIANTFYRSGVDSMKDDVFEIERVRMAIDEAAEALYMQTNLPMLKPWSQVLLPDPDAEQAEAQAAEEAAAAAEGAQAAADAGAPGASFGMPALAGSGASTALGLPQPPGAGLFDAPPAAAAAVPAAGMSAGVGAGLAAGAAAARMPQR